MRQNIYDDPRFFEGYRRMREGSSTMNELVEQPALRACLPALEGLDVLELGCGMGHMSVYLAERGVARVLATDASERMLRVARRDRAHERVEYSRCAMEDLEFDDGNFDLVVGSLCVHYVEDYPALVRKVARWLKPGGRFVYSVEHPMATAPKDPERDWVEDGEGNKLFWPVYGYGDEGPGSRPGTSKASSSTTARFPPSSTASRRRDLRSSAWRSRRRWSLLATDRCSRRTGRGLRSSS